MNDPFEIKLYSHSHTAQAPQVLAQMGFATLTRLVMGLCTMALHMFHPKGLFYVAPRQYSVNDDYLPLFEPLTLFLPMRASERVAEDWSTHIFQPDDAVCLQNWVFQIKLLQEWARLREENANEFLIGEEPYPQPQAMVYTTLHAMHEWRVLCLKDEVKNLGPGFGSLRGWHHSRYDEHVKNWPTRFGFTPKVWSPLPSEDPSFYAIEANEA